MKSEGKIVSAAHIESHIFALRGEKVLLDVDLAQIYGVPTKALNRAVKRNKERFPEDFLFQLTRDELMRCQIGTASKRNLRYRPYAFTEHGALMAANVLNSRRAVEMSVYVIRAFVRIRRELTVNETVARRLAEIERVLLNHNGALRDLYEKIRPLLLPPPDPKRREIGFHVKYDESAKAKR
jgi:ORF6N domain